MHPSWRGRAVGRELLGALFELAREQGMARVEVGLPREAFEGIRATEGFYAHNGFEPSARGCGGCSRERGVPRLLMVEQRRERGGAVPWILDERGRRIPGYDDGRRLSEVQAGLMRHDARESSHRRRERRGGRAGAAAAARARLPAGARARARSRPGADGRAAPNPASQPDTPVCAQAVATAREGVGTAISRRARDRRGSALQLRAVPPARPPRRPRLARRLLLPQQRRRGRPGAARRRLRPGRRSSISTCTTPTAPRRCWSAMTDTTLHSLHGSTGANLPWERVRPRTEREHLVAFRSAPAGETYLAALARSHRRARATPPRRSCSRSATTLVEGDPHGSWGFRAPDLRADRPPARRHRAARLRRPGGRLRAGVARGVQPRLRHRPAGRGPA